MKNIRMILGALIALLVTIPSKAEVVYTDTNARFTLIDEGTIRLEYAPDGNFVDNKSFVAVCREYGKVPCQVKQSGSQVTITTSKMKLIYKKGNAPFTKDNLRIVSAKGVNTKFTWTPGMQQQANLKGTYRTLDGYNGSRNVYEGNREMPIEDGLLARDGWTLIDDSNNFVFNGDKDWDWVAKRESAEGAQDWYFMAYGHDYKAALQSYTRFAGRVPMPPRYAFGYWWSRYWSYSDQDFRNLIQKFNQYDLPLDVLVIDMDWHPISEQAGGGWTGWDWNERLFPDYKQFLGYLDQQGVKATLNLHPADGVRPFEHKYNEFVQRAQLPEGKAYEWEGSNKTYVKALFETYLHPYFEEGVDFWWLDWQQWANDKKVEGLSNTWWCNYLFFTDMEKQGKKRPMLYHRWGGLGNHRYQVGFSGDSYITWESLEFLPYFNSTASNVLYGYWSHDIGGHQSQKFGTPVPKELYTRAMQMGEYLPILRTHSTKDAALNKEPWAFDDQTQQRLAAVINGRYSLVPYIYTMARKDYETGVSLCRPMYYDNPEKQQAYDYKSQYMFGDNMMIAPVTKPVSEDDGFARFKVWLPEGQWFEYETGTMLDGNTEDERAFNIDEYPVYIKAGSILPYYGKLKNLQGTEQPVIVRVFPGGDEGSFDLYEDNGDDCDYASKYATTPLSYTRNGNVLKVKIGARKGSYEGMPATREYQVALPCAAAPEKVVVNGKQVGYRYDGMNLETYIELGKLNCAAGAEVEVTFPESMPCSLTDGLKARFHRIQTAVADLKQREAGMVYTEPFGYLEATPMRLTYHPEKQAETLKQFCEYYDDLSIVLLEQTANEQNYTHLLKVLNEPSENPCRILPATLFQANGQEGWGITFFGNEKLEGNIIAQAHWKELNVETRESLAPGVGIDAFSLKAETNFTADATGTMFISLTGDDGYRMYINDELVLGDWSDHVATTNTRRFNVTEGTTYRIRIEFYDHVNEAVLKLSMRMTNKKKA